MKKITLLAVLFITALSYGQELITDGGFESVADGSATNGTIIEKPTPEISNGVWYSTAQYEGVIKSTSSDQDTGSLAIILDNTTTGDGTNSNIKASQLKQNLDLVAGTTYVCSYRVKKVNNLEGDDDKLLYAYVRANAGSVHQVITEDVGSLGEISDNRWITARSQLSHTEYKTVSFEFTAATSAKHHVFFSLAPDATGSPLYIDNVSITAGVLSTPKFEAFNFSYAPNPATNVLNLNAANSISDVEFINLIGQKVLTVNVNAKQKEVNVSSLDKGIYFMNVTIDGTKGTYKIIKK
jgi:hypothetical protein